MPALAASDWSMPERHARPSRRSLVINNTKVGQCVGRRKNNTLGEFADTAGEFADTEGEFAARLANALGGEKIRVVYDVFYDYTTFYTIVLRTILRIRIGQPRIILIGATKGREVGESGELDAGREKGKGLRGAACILAVIGTGGPVKRRNIINTNAPPVAGTNRRRGERILCDSPRPIGAGRRASLPGSGCGWEYSLSRRAVGLRGGYKPSLVPRLARSRFLRKGKKKRASPPAASCSRARLPPFGPGRTHRTKTVKTNSGITNSGVLSASLPL
eukprot:1182872-Prorocentrum_minimum.AAC.1